MTTAEDKFFGVTTTMERAGVKTAEPEDNDIFVDVVDDLPKKPERANGVAEDNDDDELAGYSEKVRKRIGKLKWQQGEAERRAEAAERMREEALSYAQRLMAENQQYHGLIQRGEGALVHQIKTRANLQLDAAKSKYREAYEQGDTDKIISSQEELLNAQNDFREAEKHERTLQSKPKPQAPAQVTQPPQPQYTPPAPSEKAIQWAERNSWFGPKGNKDMTALAYGVHERLVRDEGIQPDTEEYYHAIDESVRTRFPEHFEQEPQQRQTPQRRASSVVAPSKRSNASTPRRITLTSTQVALAKRLGLTSEQYAKQLIKESNND
tara:strand:+ start:599 stop:1567 length:969 start_codon:yes stop_codon:yes gene_type:complete